MDMYMHMHYLHSGQYSTLKGEEEAVGDEDRLAGASAMPTVPGSGRFHLRFSL